MSNEITPPRTIVVSGGTDGIGRTLVLDRLRRGDRAVAIGSDQGKGEALLAEAERSDAAERLTFLRADLSLVAEVERVVARITEDHRRVDALVLCANRVLTRRQETAEGLESTFALYYLSRYLLGHGLRDVLAAAPEPMIVNVSAPGMKAGRVHWDDLQLTRGYRTVRAQAQSGRANDLLGVDFAARPSSPARYVLYHPGFTRTPGGVAHLPWPIAASIRLLARIAARSPEEAADPVSRLIDAPPTDPLTAIDRGRSVDLGLPTFDPGDAARLAKETRRLIHATVHTSQLLPDEAPNGN
ncbi:SDR family NAD(P)-dependent oxidoreductase [Streptomyces profundus]|uniref:SDR family NAD(P)-dependent oxidoreductase n=1 Tax=Streptomyces profundus TaxID=2867410 RepID=UPI001D165366|nr:SDR family NAD(P)-dependent oxidoreductase [Streptomyces sp. MA3_2.13]UED84387.1 SDR family NAD(P)-dependent oxidoreductase [Streptomyces sp. MA3_2.13]